MKHAVNALPRTGLFRVLLALAFVLGGFTHEGLAASVRWEVLPDRDRVTITLNDEEGFAGGVNRISRTGLLLDLGVATAGMRQELAPENSKFFKMSEPRGRALGLFMKTAAFDFLATRPDRHTVVINAFADPRGERWTRGGMPEEPTPPGAVADEAVPPGTAEKPKQLYTAPGPQIPTPSSEAKPTDTPGVVRGSLAQSSSDAAGQAQPEPEVALPPSDSGPEVMPAARIQRSGASSSSASPATAGSGGKDVTLFRSRINTGGPGQWIEMHPELYPPSDPGTSSPLPGRAGEPKKTEGQSFGHSGDQSAGQSGKQAGEQQGGHQPGAPQGGQQAGGHQPPAEPVPTKIYVDAEGKEVPPPPNAEDVLAEARRDISSRMYKEALEKIEPLLIHPELTTAQTEEVLHLYAEMLFMTSQNDFLPHYDAIVSATTTAMNYNQESPRNPAAYLRLGYLNLKVGNTLEASVYFNRLRRQYPMDENIPLTYYYWGEYYYGRDEMQKAADEFQYIISNFSSSRYARDAAIGLARSYVALGYFQEAYDIIDYVERRWPRLYLESPPVLELMGDVGYRLGKLDFALDKYMLYYNLMPSGPTADVILTRIGDVFARQRQLAAAKAAYSEAERRFPEKDGGLVAMMRLAETGINDTPEVRAMLPVFQGTQNFKTVDIYRKIIKEHPESDLVPLAQLKLAMWNLANKRYEDALEQCTDLARKFPKHELVPRAEEVAMRAFAALAEEGAKQNRPGQVIASWEDNPLIKKQQESMPPESRVALAHSMWKQKNPDGALTLISPMFLGAKVPKHSEDALLLALTINLDFDRWDAIEKLGEQVALWELTPRVKLQLDYALALSRENLGKSEEAAPIWTRLAATGELDGKQQAYAEFFIAREAENARRLQDAYTYGRSALARFLSMAEENPDQADVPKINTLLASLMDICETSGRYAEALDYANRYMATLPPGDAQRQGLLFRVSGIYRKQGNTPEWRKALTELAEQYPDSVHGRAAASTLRSSQLAEDAAQFAPGGNL